MANNKCYFIRAALKVDITAVGKARFILVLVIRKFIKLLRNWYVVRLIGILLSFYCFGNEFGFIGVW